jgi:hypothetical protein
MFAFFLSGSGSRLFMVSLSVGSSSSILVLLLTDADGVYNLVVVPGADTVLVLAKESALAAKEVGQVLFVD